MQSVSLFLIKLKKKATTHPQIMSELIFVLCLIVGLLKETIFDSFQRHTVVAQKIWKIYICIQTLKSH